MYKQRTKHLTPTRDLLLILLVNRYIKSSELDSFQLKDKSNLVNTCNGLFYWGQREERVGVKHEDDADQSFFIVVEDIVPFSYFYLSTNSDWYVSASVPGRENTVVLVAMLRAISFLTRNEASIMVDCYLSHVLGPIFFYIPHALLFLRLTRATFFRSFDWLLNFIYYFWLNPTLGRIEYFQSNIF